MQVILGFNAFHADSAACLVIDGVLVGAVAEERLGSRIKHSAAFPENAIRWLLDSNNVKLTDITYVAVAKDPDANLAAKTRYSLFNPVSSLGAVAEHMRRRKVGSNLSLKSQLAQVCGVQEQQLSFEIVNVEHHLAHIASAYFLSPFDDLTAGLSYDGSGDFASLMAARCEGNRIEVLDKVTLPDSLGFFYSAICQFIGFDRFGEEYKVMGLAPYGNDSFRKEMSRLLTLPSDGWYRLAKGYFGMHSGGASDLSNEAGEIQMGKFYSDKLIELFGSPRMRFDDLSQREMDLARSTQVRFEEAAVHCLNKLHSLVPTTNYAMAGGCALNGVANARILRDTPFETPYLQSASSDDGTCLGAAYVVWHHTLGRKERFHMKHAFWGPEYSHADISAVYELSSHKYMVCENDDSLVEVAAKLIADGLVVGWYQGRSEWGPRALGGRSILANPGINSMKDTINAKIKRRESFRPFAPSVLKEDTGIYFEQTIDSPFMMHVVKFRSEWRDKLPAVCHVDGTGRMQTVDKYSNPLYHKLISKFKQHTGLGLVLNTSFNENEPVVDTPAQAMSCFDRTEMDALCLGRHVLLKPAFRERYEMLRDSF